MSAKRMPAWERMVREGLVSDRVEAERWILTGKVRVGAVPVPKRGRAGRHGQAAHRAGPV